MEGPVWQLKLRRWIQQGYWQVVPVPSWPLLWPRVMPKHCRQPAGLPKGSGTALAESHLQLQQMAQEVLGLLVLE
jgi:hypothetical protein